MSDHDLARELREMIDAGRSFGRHPLWIRIQEGSVSRAGAGVFARQFFLQVREFPRAVSALHTACPFPDERRKLAESLYEEETGRLSGCNLPHPELFLRFTAGLGLEREEVLRTPALPPTAALIDWFGRSTRELPFLEGAAAITLAAEGQVPGSFGPFARALERHYDLRPEAVAFWDVHELADRDHSDVGDHIVLQHACTDALRNGVHEAVEKSLRHWWIFFDGMAAAVDAAGG